MCDNYILISVRIWDGGGYTSPKGTMPTSALVPVLTYAVQTPPTARWEKVPLLESVLVFGNVLANPHLFCHLPFTAAEPVQHLEPRSVRLSLLCSSGLGAPNHPLLRGSLPESRAAFKHGRQVLQVQLNFKVFEGGKGGGVPCEKQGMGFDHSQHCLKRVWGIKAGNVQFGLHEYLFPML